MAVFSSEVDWTCLQRCLERIREGADAPLVPVRRSLPIAVESGWNVRRYLMLGMEWFC